jgi:HD-like signal output (HDOD) protein
MFGWLQRWFSGSRDAPAAAPGDGPVTAPAAPIVEAPAPSPAQPMAAPARQAAPPASAAPQPVSFEQRDRISSVWDGWLFERGADGGLDTTPAEAQVLDALATVLASQQSGAALVRRMPGLVPQLLQSLRSETFSGAALSRTISSDVVLVAEVIRLANGAYQGTGTTVTSVEHAVILIGQEGLRQLITSVAFRPIIDMHSGYYTRTLAPRLWEHAERCAIANRHLAAAAGVEPFDAFLAGLIQNVGLIVALRIMDQAAGNSRELGSEVFCAHLARHARALSCSIAREWDFPPSVTQALLEQGGVRKGVPMSPLGRLVMLTDYLARLRSLASLGLVSDADGALFAGLPAEARDCYRLLTALIETDCPA